MYIDTHTHLFSEKFEGDNKSVVQRAIANNVKKLLLPNIDLESINGMLSLCKDFPENCFAMMGLHPGSVDDDWEKKLKVIENYLFSGKEKFVAVGEIGIDLYWDKTHIKAQKEVFNRQVNWAKDLQLPIVIHAREAFDEIFEILDKENDDRLSGIFHCFTGTIEQGKKALKYGGFKLGIGGVVTYKKSGLDETLLSFSINDLVLETDSPYLAPVPYRGKNNESAYLPLIAEKIADIYKIPLAEVEEKTTHNAQEIFSLLK